VVGKDIDFDSNEAMTFPSPVLSPSNIESGFYTQKLSRMTTFEVPPHERIPLPHDNVIELPSGPFCLEEHAVAENFDDILCPQSPSSTVDMFSEIKIDPSSSQDDVQMIIVEDEPEHVETTNPAVEEIHFSETISSSTLGLSTCQMGKLSHLIDNLKRLNIWKEVRLKKPFAMFKYDEFKATHSHLSNMHRSFLRENLDLMSSGDREPIRQCITAGGKNKLSVWEAIFGVALIAYLQDVRYQDNPTFQYLIDDMTTMMSSKRSHARNQ